MESLNLIKNDPWLAPYKEAIEGRYQYVIDKEKSLTNNGKQTLAEMASGYLYFGLHKTNKGWVFREWAPNATAIYLIGTFNDWKKDERYKMRRLGYGVWEIALEEELLRHEDLFKLLVEWDGGSGDASRPGYAVSCKTNKLKYLVHRCGTQSSHMRSKTNALSLTPPRC